MSANDEEVREVAMTAQPMALVAKAELDQQITTARAYPRSLKKFVSECMDMATLNERVASECIYALPRQGKTIRGPSARLAEIVASAWGNCRAAARVVHEDGEFVTAQGIFQDLERNVAITYEVRRRITDSKGRRYNADMIGVTGNAACSIALRNAVFKGVPKAFWSDIYDAACKAAVGDIKTLATKRAEALQYLAKYGATEAMVLAALGVSGVEDIGVDELVTLKGLITAVKDGETTIDAAFAPKDQAGKPETAAPQTKAAAPAPVAAATEQAETTAEPAASATDGNGASKETAPAKATKQQVKQIEKMCDRSGVPLDAVLQHFAIADLSELPFDRVAEVVAWIDGIG